ncbi:cysteine hydrolase family protein [Pontivivens insulae]|uniref:Streptothricin hydrolase n=1 Tax=Pontivivens insulae TaxID=1639689 RepID=A0A2R8AFD7_9RHOB|nr:cysteine hydrolase family protein [Pontivivens insulae]RED12140.1 nicotinamidase-related amidase [Pontivivens insulae]SPF30896.1 Streptothricin hydrolase [Pontivivens insulae]
MNGLILIDIQRAFDAARWGDYWGARNNPEAEANAGRLLETWRKRALPVFHVCHHSTNPASPLYGADGQGFHPAVEPLAEELVFPKSVNSGFIGTDLEAELRAAGCDAVTIAGLTTPHCVSTTTRMAANLGFDVTLVHDACAAFTQNVDVAWRGGQMPSAEQIHDAAIDALSVEFATIRATADLLG